MVNIGTKNLYYLVKHKSLRSHRSWLETLQFFTAQLPRAQARVSKQIGSRPGVKVGSLVTGRWLDNWFINPIHNRLIFPQPDACPEMRWKIHEKVLRYFFPEFSQFVMMSPVNESSVSGFINQWGPGNIFSDNFDQSWTWPWISETYFVGIRQATNKKMF